jgi:ATP-dependent Clp endopeptidase proteolytic subunit ClpP
MTHRSFSQLRFVSLSTHNSEQEKPMTTKDERPRLAKAKEALEKMNAATSDQGELLVDVPAGELFLHGRIGEFDVTAKAVASALKQFKGKPVKLFINSPGGSVTEGVSIYNAAKRYEGRLTTIVDGIAGSIASLILCAASERLIDANSCIMVHEPWSGRIGNAKEMRDEAELLARFGEMVAGVYASTTGKPVAEIKRLMAIESWYFGSEAIDAGFCTAMVRGPTRPKLAAARRAAIRSRMEMLADEERAIFAAYQ